MPAHALVLLSSLLSAHAAVARTPSAHSAPATTCARAESERADAWGEFVQLAEEHHGEFGRRCAEFLSEHRPPQDAGLSAEFLLENLALALQAREEFPWASEVPEEVFLNDVLPYAVFDETREPWRARFLEMGRAIVKNCTTCGEAAQALNQKFFHEIGVHYNTGRKAPNQSPSESMAQGRATCTGLSILLVDICRAVGVPARGAGTALWTDKRGNHTWVEVWDGEWKFTGADEYDANGLNRGWFVGDASRAIAEDWRHAIWATSWQRTGDRFPMVWDLESHDVPGVNVTPRYAKSAAKTEKARATISLRVLAGADGQRIVADVDLLDSSGKQLATVTTKAGTADLNDMPTVQVEPGMEYVLRIRHGDDERNRRLRVESAEAKTVDLSWDELETGSTALRLVEEWLRLLPEERHLSVPQIALDRADADAVRARLAEERHEQIRAERAEEHAADAITLGDHTLRLLTKTFGEPDESGRSLWVSMHGGGGAPERVNDQQWHNQIRLYEPAEGIYIAPRAPTNTWNLWHQAHIDDLFDRLIENYVVFEGVDPDRVYLMGYSAGGDGVYQLAPRFADRLAAAAMMAGHPNDAQPLGLRNLPFLLFMGGEDSAYSRNAVAARWKEWLAELQSADPEGYEHQVTIYEGLGHWMEGRDQEALPWMQERRRNAWPRSIVWRQSPRTHTRFYWLAMDAAAAKGGQVVRAEVDGQTIRLEAENVSSLTVRLSDELLDLDRPIRVVRTVHEEGAEREVAVFDGTVKRSVEAIHRALLQRADPRSVATAELRLEW